jgi:TonB family protein
MRDAVAEVLAQRANIDRGGAAGLAVSIILHVSLTAVAVYAAIHQPAPRKVSTLNIRFARPSAPQPVVQSPAAPKPKPATPRIEPPKPEPIKPPEKTAKPPEKNTAPMSPFGKSSKKGSENPEPPKPTPQPAAPQVAAGQTGVTGLEGGDFPYTVYIDAMKTKIGRNWIRPQMTGEVTTVVYFVIERDGRIRDVKTETSSGSGLFDRAAERAVLGASPLAPLPFAYNGTYLGVHLTFR